MTDDILVAFADELRKIAAPRWVKELEKLPAGDAKRLISSIDKERTVRHLGSGSSRVSDLVVRPGAGLQVRKVPKLMDASKEGLSEALQGSKDQLLAEQRLKALAGGGGPFAHLVEGTPAKAYYEYAGDKVHPTVKNAPRVFKDLYRKEQDLYDKDMRGKVTRGEYARTLQGINKKQQALRQSLQREESLGPEGDAVIGKMREKFYPGLYDVRKANIVGGKLVDFEPKMKMRSVRTDQRLDLPEDAAARRAFLGGGVSERDMKAALEPKPEGSPSFNRWRSRMESKYKKPDKPKKPGKGGKSGKGETPGNQPPSQPSTPDIPDTPVSVEPAAPTPAKRGLTKGQVALGLGALGAGAGTAYYLKRKKSPLEREGASV